MADIFNDYEGEWVFVKSGNDKYIGRSVSAVGIDDCARQKIYNLQPAFYYISEYVQDPNTGSIARQLMITPVELCIGFESKVVVNDVSFSIAFKDMSVEDRRQFENAVHQGVEGMVEAKAAKSGITLESAMPDKPSILMS